MKYTKLSLGGATARLEQSISIDRNDMDTQCTVWNLIVNFAVINWQCQNLLGSPLSIFVMVFNTHAIVCFNRFIIILDNIANVLKIERVAYI